MLEVIDFIDLLVDERMPIKVWDCNKEGYIYEGAACELPSKLEYYEVVGIDVPEDEQIVINVDSE